MQPNEALSHIGAVALGLQAQIDALTESQHHLVAAARPLRPGVTLDELLHLGAGIVSDEPVVTPVEPASEKPSAPVPATTAQEPQEPAEAARTESPKPIPKADKPDGATLTGSSVAARKQARERVRSRAKAAPSSKPSSNGSGVGLAQSPKPREEMGPQQREAEERRDSVMQWIIDHGGSSDTLTIANAWGFTGAKKDKLGEDLRELARRGALEPGEMIIPEFKKDEKFPGRTTREYHVPRGATVASS